MRPAARHLANIGRGLMTAGVASGIVLSVTPAALSPGRRSQAGARSADHHLHIRSAAAAEVLKTLGDLERGDRSGDVPAPTTAADVLDALDAASVRRGLVLSIAYMFGSPELTVDDEYARVRAENDYVAEQVATRPDRLVGACSLDPLADYAFDEIERCAEDSRLAAVKFHFANSDVDLRNGAHVERLVSIFQKLGRLELPAVVHLRTRDPRYGAVDAGIFVRRVLSHAPRLPVQIAHMGGWGGYDDATDAALGVFVDALADGSLDPDLVTFDLAAVVFQPEAAGSDTALARTVREANRALAARIEQIGPERVVFATDWPSWPPTDDPRLKIAQNARLVGQALPVSRHALTQIFSNTNTLISRAR